MIWLVGDVGDMDKKSIAKGIGMGIIAGILVIGILVVVALYLNLIDKSQIIGKERAEPTVYADSSSRDIIVNALNRISEQEQLNVSDYITDIHGLLVVIAKKTSNLKI